MKKTSQNTKDLNESINNLSYERGNVRKLATQLTAVFLEHEAGVNPYKLAWDVAKQVGKKTNGDFGPKDVIKELEYFESELARTPEYDEEYFRQVGTKGSKSMSHEEHVKNGKLGAESLSNVGENGR